MKKMMSIILVILLALGCTPALAHTFETTDIITAAEIESWALQIVNPCQEIDGNRLYMSEAIQIVQHEKGELPFEIRVLYMDPVAAINIFLDAIEAENEGVSPRIRVTIISRGREKMAKLIYSVDGESGWVPLVDFGCEEYLVYLPHIVEDLYSAYQKALLNVEDEPMKKPDESETTVTPSESMNEPSELPENPSK